MDAENKNSSPRTSPVDTRPGHRDLTTMNIDALKALDPKTCTPAENRYILIQIDRNSGKLHRDITTMDIDALLALDPKTCTAVETLYIIDQINKDCDRMDEDFMLKEMASLKLERPGTTFEQDTKLPKPTSTPPKSVHKDDSPRELFPKKIREAGPTSKPAMLTARVPPPRVLSHKLKHKKRRAILKARRNRRAEQGNGGAEGGGDAGAETMDGTEGM